ncbi:MAG: hypothetical protein AB7W16_15955 [Candidatus Obscuribacterales bacterium]
MNSKTRANMAIAVTSVVSLIALGFLYGSLFSITPAGWQAPASPLHLAVGSVLMALCGLWFLTFFFYTPYGLVFPAALLCAIYSCPRSGFRQHLQLGIPLLPMMFMPVWAVYVSSSRPESHTWGAFKNSWEMHVLTYGAEIALIGLGIAALYFLLSPGWRKKRFFVLSVLVLEVFILGAEYYAASWPVANVWL